MNRFWAMAMVVGLLAGPAVGQTNVTVFNFQMKSQTPDWLWLEKCLADQITTDLSQGQGLTVVARDRMQDVAEKIRWAPELAGDAKAMQRIRGELRVNLLVSGTYSLADGQVEITAQIVNVADRQEVFRKTLTGKPEQIIDLQKQMSSELLGWLTKRPPAAILKELPIWTRSIPALKALYEGMDLYDRGRYAEGWLKFRQASREDAAYMEAVYWVGKMYYFMDRYEHARRALERFVYLDATHPRIADAAVEYLHTYETREIDTDTLVKAYARFAERFPNDERIGSDIWLTKPSWAHQKMILRLARDGRYGEAFSLHPKAITWKKFFSPGVWKLPPSISLAMRENALTGKAVPTVVLQGEDPDWLSPVFRKGPDGVEWMSHCWTSDGPCTIRILGAKYRFMDKAAAACGIGTNDRFWLTAPSGHVFKSLRFYPVAKGEDATITISLSQADLGQNLRNTSGEEDDAWKLIGPHSGSLPEAIKGGVLFDALPRTAYLRVNWALVVNDHQESKPVEIQGVRVVAELEAVGAHGALDVWASDYPDYLLAVDGVPTRYGPGLVGPLTPGEHVLTFSPVPGDELHESWSTKVVVEADKVAPVVGRLPWKDGIPWTTQLISTKAGLADNRGLALDLQRTTVWADAEGIFLVWSDGGDLWSSYSRDGKSFTPARKLDLPVSSGWDESFPNLCRDETGRHVLLFYSDRGVRHWSLCYATWSRDFIHWSAPALIKNEVGESVRGTNSNLLPDNRGRLLIAGEPSGRKIPVYSSDDGLRWGWLSSVLLPYSIETDKTTPFSFLYQQDDGSYVLLVAAARILRKEERKIGGPAVVISSGQNVIYQKSGSDTDHSQGGYYVKTLVYRFVSQDAKQWGNPQVLVLPYMFSPTISAISIDGRPCVFLSSRFYGRSGLCDDNYYGVMACIAREVGEDTWEVSPPMCGLWLDTPSVSFSAKWGCIAAYMHSPEYRSYPHPGLGPFIMRGADLWPPGGKKELTKALSLPDFKQYAESIKGRRPHDPLPLSSPVGRLHYYAGFSRSSTYYAASGMDRYESYKESDGVMSPKAQIVTINESGMKASIGLDYATAEDTIPNVVLLDLTGQGNFRNAIRLSFINATNFISSTAINRHYAGLVTLKTGIVEYPAAVMVDEIVGDQQRKLMIRASYSAQAICHFGKKMYRVVIVNEDGNLKLGDRVMPLWNQTSDTLSPWEEEWRELYRGDTVYVETGRPAEDLREIGGPYANSVWQWKRAGSRGFCGHPIQVDDKLYVVNVSADGASAVVEPFTGPTGKLHIDKPLWTCLLIGNKHILRLDGKNEPVDVPADTYRILDYRELKDLTRKNERLSLRWNPGQTVQIHEGRTTGKRIGSPLNGVLTMQQEGREMDISLKWKDVNGAEVRYPNDLNDLQIDLFDASGKRVSSIKSRRWIIPQGMSGEYKAVAAGSLPVEAELPSTTITIK